MRKVFPFALSIAILVLGASMASAKAPKKITETATAGPYTVTLEVLRAEPFSAKLDPKPRPLSYTAAAHTPPLLRRASGRIERLEVTNLPLGIRPGLEFATGSATLGEGDVLLIFTDGLVESMTAAEDEFGEERVTAWLKSAPAASAEAMLVSLLSTVDGFTGGARQHDDLTCLFLRVS